MVRDELEMAMEQTGCGYPVTWLDAGLHNRPDRLPPGRVPQEGGRPDAALTRTAKRGIFSIWAASPARFFSRRYHEQIHLLRRPC